MKQTINDINNSCTKFNKKTIFERLNILNFNGNRKILKIEFLYNIINYQKIYSNK